MSSASIDAKPPQDRTRPRRRWLLIAISVCVAVALAIGIAIGAGAGVGDWPDLPQLLDRATAWRASPLAPFVVLACFGVGGLIVFPVNLLIAATVLVFGPVLGTIYALAGSMLSAIVLYEIGRKFPQGAVTRVIGTRGEWLRSHVAQHGFLAVAVVRVLPLAPYSIVCLAAGAVRIGRGAYLAGTALGMMPGILLYAFFIDRARAVIANPGALTWAMLGFALVLIVAVTILLRRYAGRSAIAANRDDS
ncbi:MAG: TVP38/TMEM64 family protein [Rhodanobacteraceae bacterium]